MQPVEVFRGSSPVILGLPHTGTYVPDDVAKNLNSNGKLLRDTDWHVHELYEGLLPEATTVRATFHRYVIDANRDPSGQSLYPGQNTTGLIPLTDFDDQPLWNEAPDEAETARRLEQFHRPYHAVLADEIERVKKINGIAILYDCHSIRSTCPFLFEGQLPDFSIGTNDGLSCAAEIEETVRKTCAELDGYTHVVNGRFKGGWTTRHYGRPEKGVHAIQMELTQRTHLASESLPFALETVDKSPRLRKVLRKILQELEALAPKLAGQAR